MDFSQAYAGRLKETLEHFGLRLTMIASGAFANRNGLSLSSPDQDVRAKSVQAGECVIWGDYFYMEALVRM